MSKAVLHSIKFPANVKKIKVTTLNYLYEIAAIPEKIRLEYLEKLLKRKNASSQKNVQLLNIIYYHIKEERMLEWDDTNICRLLNVSKDMLFCHKSRILKSLRFLYYDWKNIEKEAIEKSVKYDLEKTSETYVKAQAMSKIGMWREAKNEYLKEEKRLTVKRQKTIEDKILLCKIYKSLISYYHHRADKTKFTLYYKKSEKICNSLMLDKTVKRSRELNIQVLLIHNYLKIHNSYFNVKATSNRAEIINIFSGICSLFNKYEDKTKYILSLQDMGLLHLTQGNFKEALSYLEEGKKLSKEYDMLSDNILFKMYILLIKIRTKKIDRDEALTELLKYNEQLEKLDVRGSLRERALLCCNEVTAVQEDKNMFYNFLYKYNSVSILTYGYKYAIRTLYYMKFAYYQKQLRRFRFEKQTDKKIPVLFGIDPIYKAKLINTSSEVLQNFDKMRNARMLSIHFRWEAMLGILETEFWKGEELNYDYAQNLIKSMNRFRKSWGMMVQGDKIEFKSLKLCIDIINDSRSLNKQKLLNKYELKFKDLSQEITADHDESIIQLYSIYSYTAQIAKHKELKAIAADLYLNLKRKYPEKMKAIIDEMRQDKNKTFENIKFNTFDKDFTSKAA